MFNIVEWVAGDEEQEASPCLYGNIVKGHACYCQDDDWEEGPRKCPVWRAFGASDVSKWHRRDWERIEVPMHYPEPEEMRPSMPDDGRGGCPHFVQRPADVREPEGIERCDETDDG